MNSTVQNKRYFKYIKVFAILFIIISVVSYPLISTHADECKNISDSDDKIKCYANQEAKATKQLSSVQDSMSKVVSQLNQLGGQLTLTQDQIDDVQDQIKDITNQLGEINKNLDDRRTKLADKIALRNHVIRNYSKRTILNDLELFLATPIQVNSGDKNNDLNGFQFAYFSHIFNKTLNDTSVSLISLLNGEISSFEKDKAEAEKLAGDLKTQQAKLATLKDNLAKQKQNAQTKYADLGKEEKSLQQKIADLNAKQQAILNEKNGDSSGTVGDYTPPSAKTPNPPFSPAFAAFSYGAYTHYNGMSQYGAKGRAEAGQDYKKILKFYYKVDVTTKSDFPKKINVKGYGEIDFQYYLYGLAEMPSDWPDDALKSQAIAARTYAYKANKPICTTESCQVFLKSKADNPPSKWKKAVDDTKNMILNNPATSQFSSTTGGYINNIGWDVSGDWPGDAYEKKAGSPWFYKAWYTKGYSGTDSCGHPHPWLSSKEMADILNSWVVWRKGSSGDKSHISPVTTNCWGGDPYSLDEMADKADDLGEKYSSVSSVDVDISNSGYTSKVTIGTNNGTVTMSGDEFKTVFNLRAPGYISIKSKLFDLEKR